MGAQTQIFDDGSTLTTDAFGVVSSTPATDRLLTTNGAVGSPEWSGLWQQAASSVLSISTDYARARLAGQQITTAAPARPAGAIRSAPSDGMGELVMLAVVGVVAYLAFRG